MLTRPPTIATTIYLFVKSLKVFGEDWLKEYSTISKLFMFSKSNFIVYLDSNIVYLDSNRSIRLS